MTVSVAAGRAFWPRHDIAPGAGRGGTPLGEWSAHVLAGTLSCADAVRSVKARGHAMQQAVPPGQGAMAAVLAPRSCPRWRPEACEEAVRENGPLSVQRRQPHSPGQTVISDSAAGLKELRAVQSRNVRAAGSDTPRKRSFHWRADASRRGEEVGEMLAAWQCTSLASRGRNVNGARHNRRCHARCPSARSPEQCAG